LLDDGFRKLILLFLKRVLVDKYCKCKAQHRTGKLIIIKLQEELNISDLILNWKNSVSEKGQKVMKSW